MVGALAELRALLADTAAQAGVPGAALGILHEGRESVLCTGVASLDTGQPVDADTLFIIGSTTKTFTGALLMSLAQEGSLELDQPISTYLPELRLADPVAQATITARHLLTHTSGLLGDRDLGGGWAEDAIWTAVEQFGQLPQCFPPGDAFSYSNSGFTLAGYLAEVIAGSPFEDLVRTRILAPLGMLDSVFLPWEVLTRKHAVGHAMVDGAPRVSRMLGIDRAAGPAGGLWSTARDQLRWARFWVTGETSGTEPISATTRAAMWVPQRTGALPFEEVGLSWLRMSHGDAEVVRHGGNVSNLQVSEFVTLPAHNLAVTVLANSGGGGELGPVIVDWCIENLAGLPRLAPRPVVDKPVAGLGEYVGRYHNGDLAFDLTLTGARLSAQLVFPGNGDLPVPPPFELAFVDEEVISRAADTRHRSGRFLRDQQGRLRGLEFGGRTLARAS
ncbi:serine hydrolase domain-containing protein [Crossiella sp. CA198]|uniref:serine hydrolase domain-containing protein n=1 Tax=Crossiella sp. CA198 TaxID=3455607 RepID=UPI003F8D157D